MDRLEKDKLDTKATAEFIASKLKDPTNGEAYYRGYLRAGFLEDAVNTLQQVRRQAGLTQAQVAEKLNTKQAAIARLEDDTEGAMSLRRYVDFLMACEVIPYNITYVPINAVHDYTIEHPQAPLTQENYHTWLFNREIQSVLVSQNAQSSLLPNQPLLVPATTVRASSPPILNCEGYPKRPSLLVQGDELPTPYQEKVEEAA